MKLYLIIKPLQQNDFLLWAQKEKISYGANSKGYYVEIPLRDYLRKLNGRTGWPPKAKAHKAAYDRYLFNRLFQRGLFNG